MLKPGESVLAVWQAEAVMGAIRPVMRPSSWSWYDHEDHGGQDSDRTLDKVGGK